jgi:hypothetical protein
MKRVLRWRIPRLFAYNKKANTSPQLKCPSNTPSDLRLFKPSDKCHI